MRAVCFVGWSGSGKTTLVERLVPILSARGHAVGYFKSHKREFDMDYEGKDTDRIYRAGAARVAIASPTEAALRWRIEQRDPEAMLERYFKECDLVLLEGFKGCGLKKIEVVKDGPLGVEGVIALVSDEDDGRSLPRFSRDDLEAIARFVEKAPLD